MIEKNGTKKLSNIRISRQMSKVVNSGASLSKEHKKYQKKKNKNVKPHALNDPE